MSNAPYHKKKNLFKFFKSPDFNKARVLLCVIHILVSYANELLEEVARLLQGYEGMMIGPLLHKAKAETKALDDFDKEYAKHIEGGMGQMADINIAVTTELDNAIKQNEFFLQEGRKAIVREIEKQVEKNVDDPEELQREKFAGFEIFDPETRKETLQQTLKRARTVYKNHPHLGSLLEGMEKGFNIACDFTNEIYLKS